MKRARVVEDGSWGDRGQALLSRAWLAGAFVLVGASPAVAGPVDYASVVLADNPRGYFRLGEAPGATTAFNDPGASGGASMNGTYVNAPTLGVAGIPGADPNTAALLAAASQQGVTDIMDPFAYTSFTLEAWVKTPSTSPQGIIVYTDSSGPLNAYSNALTITNDGDPRFRFYVYNSRFVDIKATSPLSVDTLYHVVGTAVSGGDMKLYVNGTLEASASLAGGSLWTGGTRWLLGSRVGNASAAGYLDGLLDEVAIYPTILDPTTIRAHYAAGIQSFAVPEIDPAGMGSVLALLSGALGLLERRRATST